MRRLIRSERGQALVETAIVMPVIVLMLFGILDAGRIFSTWIVINNASREGARAGAVRQSTGQITTAALNAASSLSPAPSVAVTNAQGTSGTSVTVLVSTNVSMITPGIAAIFGATVNVSNSAVMRLE